MLKDKITTIDTNFLNPHDIIIEEYPDGTPVFNRPIDKHMDISVLTIHTSRVSTLMYALFLVDAYHERTGGAPYLRIPYVPGARQDRLQAAGDYLFTAKSVAKEINARNTNGVEIYDPHSDVIAGMINKCVVYSPASRLPTFAYDMGFDAIIAPDAGAAKRAGEVAKAMHLPVFQAWKHRDITGKLSGFGCEEIPMSIRHALIVDDICDGGGTFFGLAEALYEKRRIDLSLYVSHGILSQGTETLLQKFKNVITTDSLTRESNDGLKVIKLFK